MMVVVNATGIYVGEWQFVVNTFYQNAFVGVLYFTARVICSQIEIILKLVHTGS
jgi:hypothetical protein